MSTAIRITKRGFEVVEKSLELYTKVLDEVVPWKSIEETVKGMARNNSDHSLDAAETIGEILTLTLNTTNKYFSAKQSLSEWCSLTVRLIATYKLLFDKHDENNIPARKQLLLKVLDDGMEKINAAHAKLEEISSSFNLVAGKLTTLIDQVAVNKNFYENLKTQIEKANTDMKNAKSKLDADIGTVGLQSTQTEQNPASAPIDMDRLHDDIIGPVNNLVIQCEEFKKRND